MRDIPIFTTENGAAALILREIPYHKIAYVTILSSLEPEKLLKECVKFCKMAGAEQVCATGHEILGQFPVYAAIWQMEVLRESLQKTDAVLHPLVTEELELWRSLHNERMSSVTNSATLSRREVEGYQQKGSAWFVYRDGVRIGLGVVTENKVESVISLVSGSGKDVLLALCSAITGDIIRLEVSSENHRALSLYRRMGFQKTKELTCWYNVTK